MLVCVARAHGFEFQPWRKLVALVIYLALSLKTKLLVETAAANDRVCAQTRIAVRSGRHDGGHACVRHDGRSAVPSTAFLAYVLVDIQPSQEQKVWFFLMWVRDRFGHCVGCPPSCGPRVAVLYRADDHIRWPRAALHVRGRVWGQRVVTNCCFEWNSDEEESLRWGH